MKLDDVVPSDALGTVLFLVNAIVRVVQAGADAKAREDALMKAAEDLKAEMDRLKFGG